MFSPDGTRSTPNPQDGRYYTAAGPRHGPKLSPQSALIQTKPHYSQPPTPSGTPFPKPPGYKPSTAIPASDRSTPKPTPPKNPYACPLKNRAPRSQQMLPQSSPSKRQTNATKSASTASSSSAPAENPPPRFFPSSKPA